MGTVCGVKTDLPQKPVISRILGQEKGGFSGRSPPVAGDLPGFPGKTCPEIDILFLIIGRPPKEYEVFSLDLGELAVAQPQHSCQK